MLYGPLKFGLFSARPSELDRRSDLISVILLTLLRSVVFVLFFGEKINTFVGKKILLSNLHLYGYASVFYSKLRLGAVG